MRAHSLLCLLLLAACGDNLGSSLTPDAPARPDAMPDAMVPDGIAEARATADGTGLDLSIRFVTVTYVKPAVGSPMNDPAGFTIQAAQTGPALFVSVDPATLSPPPAVGDVVHFQINALGTVAMQKRAQTISDYRRIRANPDVGALAQNITAANDVVSMLDSYDSELVTVTGTVVNALGSAGASFLSSDFNTAGLTGDPNYEIRVPASVADAVDMTMGCQVTATRVPMHRFNTQAQIGAYSPSDVTLSGCAAPVVTFAVALSATQVRLSFSRRIRPASVLANGSQFTFDNGVTATAATVSGRTVTVTTSAQALGTGYTVTVANTVTDLQGTGVATPNTASFAGAVPPAVVRINELNANIGSGCDLIELRVVSGGVMTGFKLQERTGSGGELVQTFPALTVQTNDFVVVHLSSGSATCNPNAATQETTAPNAQPTAMFAGNFDTAYDFWNADAGLTATDNVLTLFDGAGTIVDAVFVSDDPAGPTAANPTEAAAASVGAANQWMPALPEYLDTVFRMNAVDDLNATGTAATGNSIQRIDNTDDNNKADWTTGAGAAQTWGAINAGQTAF